MKHLNEISPKEITLVTHANCMDGTGSAMAMKEYCKQRDIKLDIVFATHGEIIKKDLNGLVVVMADFSLSRDQMEYLNEITEFFVCIDHHVTAMENMQGLDYCIFNMEESGATLLWWYLFDTDAPEILKYIKDRDIWKWEMPNSKEVNAGLRHVGSEFILEYSEQLLHQNSFDHLLGIGKTLIEVETKYIDTKEKQLTKNDFFNIAGYDVPCINNGHEISVVGNRLAKGNPFSAQYFITADSIVFSLRSDEDGVNVGNIARSFGGGGHEHAAGFSFKLNEVDLNYLLKSKDMQTGSFDKDH